MLFSENVQIYVSTIFIMIKTDYTNLKLHYQMEQHFCDTFHDFYAWDVYLSFVIRDRFIYKCLNVCHFDCTTVAAIMKVYT